jgi:HEAT repeat protein
MEGIGILNFRTNIMNQLGKNLNRFIFILMATLLCSCATMSPRTSEPTYNGKALSEWLQLNCSGQDLDGSAEVAIRQIGTNAIPALLEILQAAGPEKRTIAARLKSPELKEAANFRGDPDSNARADQEFRRIAVHGFEILGTNAEPAIPQLTKLLYDPASICRDEAAMVLAKVGPKGFSVLTNAFKDEALVGFVSSAIGHNSSPVVTELLICALQNSDPISDPILRGNAADSLRGRDATLAVPALIPLLDDNHSYVWHFAASALGSYGSAAKSAAPKLLSLYTNSLVLPGNGERVFVLDALRKIDPAAAGQAEAVVINGGPLGVAGDGWTVTKLPNGKELITGGSFQTTIPTVTNHVFSRAEIFDPVTGKRTETGSMKTAREFHTATLLRNGKVLIVGGRDSNYKALTTAELFDPATGKWTETGSMNSPHPNQNAVLQRDGKVRVWGSEGSSVPPDDLYDPATGKWTMTSRQ